MRRTRPGQVDRRAPGITGHAEFDENVLGVGILDTIDNDADGAAISDLSASQRYQA